MDLHSCYTFEVLNFDNPVFKTIPVSYLITMEGSKRRDSYIHQLNTYKPTRKVVIVKNMGFKKCNKPPWVNTSAMDLWHVNLTILEKHIKESSAPVLILEDDVEFTDNLLHNSKEIEEFITQDHVDVYSLGSQTYVSYPVSLNDVRIVYGACTQAIIFTNTGAVKFQGVNRILGLHDCDMFMQLNSYMGTTPSATQRFGSTINSQEWDYGGVLLKYNQMFGNQFFNFHALISILGGIIPFYAIWVLLFFTCVYYILHFCRKSLLT